MSSRILKSLSTIVIGISLLGFSSQVITARTSTAKLGRAQDKPTSPIAKKGQKIFVVIKDTKKQTVPVVTSRNKRTKKTVKMGTIWKVRATKKVRKTRIYRINGRNRWLRSHDVTKY